MSVYPDVPGFLVDGFPRNLNNLDGWMQMMDSSTNLVFVLEFVSPEQLCRERCFSRTCLNRPDDNEATLLKRFAFHEEYTKPAIEHLRLKGQVHQVNTEFQQEAS
jgi:UMP-CMP kinase